MATSQHQRHPFEPIRNGYDYRALWDANFAWGVIALAMMLFALAIWAFMASGWYQPPVTAPIDVPAVEIPASANAVNPRAEMPPTTTLAP
jgi:hypothetical protein